MIGVNQMSKRKTQEEFEEELRKINGEIEVIGKYVNANTKIKCRCKICGCVWDNATPHSLLYKHSCPKCFRIKRANKDRKPYKQFLSDLSKINKNIVVSGEYKNTESKLNCSCKVCGYTWVSTPHKLSQKCGCPKCRGVAKKTTEEFIKELKEINRDILVIGDYINNRTKIKCQCKICGNTWNPSPHDLLTKKSGCPICAESKGEKRISQYLLDNSIEFQRQVTFDGLVGLKNGLLSYDFYLPKYNLLIEYQGQYHDGSIIDNRNKSDALDRQLEHDKRKAEYAKKKKIRLLEIWYYDYENIESILNSRIY